LNLKNRSPISGWLGWSLRHPGAVKRPLPSNADAAPRWGRPPGFDPRTRRILLSVRGVIVVVAIVVCLAITHSSILFPGGPDYVAVSAVVGGFFALGAMRHPWFFLAIVVSLWAVLPSVSDSSAHDLFVGCYQGGWFLGAIAGKIIRRFRERTS